MALRLGEHVEWGFLCHSRRNATHGYIKLSELEHPIHLDLTGDPSIELHGKAIRFEPRLAQEETPTPLPKFLQVIHPHQVGPTGMMTIERGVRTYPECDMDRILELAKSPAGLPPPVWKRCLTLEWYSQNGRMLIELADPLIWVADSKDANSDDESVWIVPAEPLSWEPMEQGSLFEGLADEEPQLDWYPGCDRRDEREMSSEEFIKELELMDDLVTGDEPGESLHAFIAESVPSGPVERLSDEEAEAALKAALAQLALRSVAVHVCEHFSARDALNYLRTVVADEGEYHPELLRSAMVQNYMTAEGCPQCEAEMDKEFEQYESELKQRRDNEGESKNTG